MRRASDVPTRWGRAKRLLRRHSDSLVIVAMTSLMLLGVWQLGEQQNDRRGDFDVASCERGNIIRTYLAFDNAESILVLRAGLQGAQRNLSPREQRAREESLARRIDVQKVLTPFPCETLR